MKIITCSSFNDFIDEAIRELEWTSDKRKNYPFESIPQVYFRGQSDQKWELETTLERYTKRSNKKIITEQEYHHTMTEVINEVSSTLGVRFTIGDYVLHPNPMPPVGYDFMIYPRHHRFPSPLLDWTRSPYVAAFFAFEKAKKDAKYVAIFMYRDSADGERYGWAGEPTIYHFRSNVRTDRRHFRQQAEYTVCYSRDDKQKIWRSHEKAHVCGDGQCILKKYLVPVDDQRELLSTLDYMNINKYTSFGGDDAFMETLAFREFCMP